MKIRAEKSPEQLEKQKENRKTLLSVVFFILTLLSALQFTVCMIFSSMKESAAGQAFVKIHLVEAYGLSERTERVLINRLLCGAVGYWFSLGLIVLWFALWMILTKRFMKATKGLGISCAVAALVQLIGGGIFLILTSILSLIEEFRVDEEELPGIFGNVCVDLMIMALFGMLVTALIIFIEKMKKRFQTKQEGTASDKPEKTEQTAVSEHLPEQTKPTEKTGEKEKPGKTEKPVSMDLTSLTDLKASAKSEAEPAVDEAFDETQTIESVMAGMVACPACGAKNIEGTSFCYACGESMK